MTHDNFREIEPFCDEIRSRFGEDSVVLLFGSRATTHFDEECSDYDILVIAEFGKKARKKGLTKKVFGINLDLLCVTPKEYRKILEGVVESEREYQLEAKLGLSGEVAIDTLQQSVCLTGEESFRPFMELCLRWMAEGKLDDPRWEMYPSLSDGLVPVQRALLDVLKSRNFTKCAQIVYQAHCSEENGLHGYSFIYRVLVAMAQSFTSRYPLIDGQGNFGSIEGDPPADMRYVECRASNCVYFCREKMRGDFVYNDQIDEAITFLQQQLGSESPVKTEKLTDSIKEIFTPDRTNDCLVFPNLLANGTLGIPSMLAMFPPFSLKNISKALALAITHPKTGDDELLETIGLPDFSQGEAINRTQSFQALSTGEGYIEVQGGIQTQANNNRYALITEIPYGVRRDLLVEAISKADDVESAYDISEELTKIEVMFNSGMSDEAIREMLYSIPLMKNQLPINLTVVNDDNEFQKVTIPQVIRDHAERRLKAHEGNCAGVLDEIKALSKLGEAT